VPWMEPGMLSALPGPGDSVEPGDTWEPSMKKITQQVAYGALAMFVASVGCSDPLRTQSRSPDARAGTAVPSGTPDAVSPGSSDGASGSTPDTAIADPRLDASAGPGERDVARPTPAPDAPSAVPVPDGFVPPASWGWGDAGSDAYDELCASTPNPVQNSCVCLPNPDFAGDPGPGCAARADGQACTRDCCGGCGLEAERGVIGSIRRDCVGGVYAHSTCVPPAGFKSGLVGGACAPPVEYGTIATFTSAIAQGMACNQEWRVCFTQGDRASGVEHGCACLFDEDTGLLKLACGPVFGWFQSGGEAWTFASGLIWKNPPATSEGP
jgi:hypothetical protein